MRVSSVPTSVFSIFTTLANASAVSEAASVCSPSGTTRRSSSCGSSGTRRGCEAFREMCQEYVSAHRSLFHRGRHHFAAEDRELDLDLGARLVEQDGGEALKCALIDPDLLADLEQALPFVRRRYFVESCIATLAAAPDADRSFPHLSEGLE